MGVKFFPFRVKKEIPAKSLYWPTIVICAAAPLAALVLPQTPQSLCPTSLQSSTKSDPRKNSTILRAEVGQSKNLPPEVRERVEQHRRLGQAYYEDPKTQPQAVDEFKLALDLVPDSTLDRVNYGLALARAGKKEEAIAELTKAQDADPSIPHTWFTLGIIYKQEFEHQKAMEQFERMLKLVPGEPVTHYNLGLEYKLLGKPDLALSHFIAASCLDPNFAAPHFQLWSAYRELGRGEDAAREMDFFTTIKRRKAETRAVEDPESSTYSDLYGLVSIQKH